MEIKYLPTSYNRSNDVLYVPVMGPISTISGTRVSLSEDRAWGWPFTSNLCRGYCYVMFCKHFHHSSRRSTWTPGKFNVDRIFICWYLCYRTRDCLHLSLCHARTQTDNLISLPSFDVPWISPLLLQVAPQCKDILLQCVWKGRVQESCSKIFSLRKTYEGYCCSFNYVGLKEDILKWV
jgi:hypothetical protein